MGRQRRLARSALAGRQRDDVHGHMPPRSSVAMQACKCGYSAATGAKGGKRTAAGFGRQGGGQFGGSVTTSAGAIARG
jgi:hypothetical protein